MKNFLRGLEILIILGMFAAGFYAYPWLPDQIPSHWGVSGQVDDYMSKDMGIWLLPIITAVIAMLLPLIRFIDPRKQNYKKFEIPFMVFQLTFVAYFAYIFGIQLYASLHPEFAGSAATAILAGMGVLFVIFGIVMPRIKWNFFVGVRTPWTLASEKVWNKTHAFTGKLWVIMGFAIVATSIGHGINALVVFIPIIIAAVGPIVYSYAIFPTPKKKA